MSKRTNRREVARRTVEILERGHYTTDGVRISIGDHLRAAVEGTRLYTPDELANLRLEPLAEGRQGATTFRVENRTTFAAVRALVADGIADPLCLNFASAKNPGGGFLNGSQAQEESLARGSGLYACINPVRGYYETNRGCGTALYTHHMIHSPRVPVFRDDRDLLLPEPVFASIITAPAVNAGAVARNEPRSRAAIEPTMLERIGYLLEVAIHHGHRVLVLGAWGCGVFRNDPARVADWFHAQLVENPRYRNAFDHVEFAVLDHTDGESTLRPFARRFGERAPVPDGE